MKDTRPRGVEGQVFGVVEMWNMISCGIRRIFTAEILNWMWRRLWGDNVLSGNANIGVKRVQSIMESFYCSLESPISVQ